MRDKYSSIFGKDAQVAKITKKENRNNAPTVGEQEKVSLWMKHGIEDVYFQRDAMVNFWTVLGGIAVAALLTQLTNLIEEIELGHWHLLLYFITSITLIVNSWVQNLWGGLVLKLPVTIPLIFLDLADLVCLAIICLQITNPLIFLAAGGFFIMFALFLQIYHMRSGAWIAFTNNRIQDIKTMLWVYLVFMILCFVAAIHLFLHPSVVAEVGWGFFALVASVAALFMQHYGMKQERKELGIP